MNWSPLHQRLGIATASSCLPCPNLPVSTVRFIFRSQIWSFTSELTNSHANRGQTGNKTEWNRSEEGRKKRCGLRQTGSAWTYAVKGQAATQLQSLQLNRKQASPATSSRYFYVNQPVQAKQNTSVGNTWFFGYHFGSLHLCLLSAQKPEGHPHYLQNKIWIPQSGVQGPMWSSPSHWPGLPLTFTRDSAIIIPPHEATAPPTSLPLLKCVLGLGLRSHSNLVCHSGFHSTPLLPHSFPWFFCQAEVTTSSYTFPLLFLIFWHILLYITEVTCLHCQRGIYRRTETEFQLPLHT